jgi:hypothetical protein
MSEPAYSRYEYHEISFREWVAEMVRVRFPRLVRFLRRIKSVQRIQLAHSGLGGNTGGRNCFNRRCCGHGIPFLQTTVGHKGRLNVFAGEPHNNRLKPAAFGGR